MTANKIAILLRENWDIMPRYKKVQLLEILHQDYSLREMARLLDKNFKTIHYYLRYETRNPIRCFLDTYIVGQQYLDNFSQLCEVIEQLPSNSFSEVSDPSVKLQNGLSPPIIGDDERSLNKKRGEHSVRF